MSTFSEVHCSLLPLIEIKDMSVQSNPEDIIDDQKLNLRQYSVMINYSFLLNVVVFLYDYFII
jgi:hypothetical protein